MKDALGDRIKKNYESRYKYFLPRRTYTIIRLDGKAFHTYTANLKKPFDDDLIEDINQTIVNVLPHIQGAVFAYTQSDEISILLADFATIYTDAWFDGNLQKLVSVSASLVTAEFNKLRILRNFKYSREEGDIIHKATLDDIKLACFDSRVFTIPDRTEVMNYFIWRNNDSDRNSISTVAQSLFSHRALQGVSSIDMKKMILKKTNTSWDAFPDFKKYGRVIYKDSVSGVYNVLSAWKFKEDKNKLLALIPDYPV
jgi:tRNA(His) guanylyltransferase